MYITSTASAHWNVYSQWLYAVMEVSTGTIIGLVEASGPKNGVNPGWWIDSSYRGKGYGKALVCALATYLKDQGYKYVFGVINKANPGGLKGALRAGFEEIDKIKTLGPFNRKIRCSFD